MRTNKKGKTKFTKFNKMAMAFIFYFLNLFFILLLLGEEMWKFNCWRVSLQLSNFIYLVFFFFFFRLVSQGRQAFGQYFYRHHFFSSSLNMPLISLVSEGERRRRRRRRRERERERGDLLRVTGSSNSSGNSHTTHNRKERKKEETGSSPFCFFDSLVVCIFSLTFQFNLPRRACGRSFLLVNYSK